MKDYSELHKDLWSNQKNALELNIYYALIYVEDYTAYLLTDKVIAKKLGGK